MSPSAFCDSRLTAEHKSPAARDTSSAVMSARTVFQNSETATPPSVREMPNTGRTASIA